MLSNCSECIKITFVKHLLALICSHLLNVLHLTCVLDKKMCNSLESIDPHPFVQGGDGGYLGWVEDMARKEMRFFELKGVKSRSPSTLSRGHLRTLGPSSSTRGMYHMFHTRVFFTPPTTPPRQRTAFALALRESLAIVCVCAGTSTMLSKLNVLRHRSILSLRRHVIRTGHVHMHRAYYATPRVRCSGSRVIQNSSSYHIVLLEIQVHPV